MPHTLIFKALPYIIGLLAIVGAFLYVKNIGVKECENKVIIKEVTANVERQKINREVRSMDAKSVINELDTNGWLRD